MLDQLARLDADKDRISEEQHEGLKKLCLDNDEDIFVYFEEYVEKSGPVYQNKINEAYKAFVRFGRKAKDVYARSKYGNQKKKAAKVNKCPSLSPALTTALFAFHLLTMISSVLFCVMCE